MPRYVFVPHGFSVYTPIRVLMGGSDSVAYCQAAVQEIFRDLLYRGLLRGWMTCKGMLKMKAEPARSAQDLPKSGVEVQPVKVRFF